MSESYRFMYRRDGEGDKYMNITDVLDQIQDRLDAIENKLIEMENKDAIG